MPSPSSPSPVVAIVLMCAAGLCFAVLDATVKYLGAETDIPIMEIIWIRFVVHAALSIVFLGPRTFPG